MDLRLTFPPKRGLRTAFHCFRASQRDMKAPSATSERSYASS